MQKKKNAAKGVAAKILGSGVLTWVLLLAIWKAGSLFYPPEFLPGPLETWKGAFSLISDGTLAGDVWVSLGRVLKGWVLGVVFAVPVGVCVGCFPWAGRIFEPFLNFFRFVPAIGFITLFLLWFGVGETSKVALIFYAVIFTGIRLGLGSAIICIAAAEMLAASEGVGYLIYTSRLYYRTDWIFTGIFTLGLMGLAADKLLRILGKRFLSRFGVR